MTLVCSYSLDSRWNSDDALGVIGLAVDLKGETALRSLTGEIDPTRTARAIEERELSDDLADFVAEDGIEEFIDKKPLGILTDP